MASTLLERTRQLHEDIERAERMAAKDMKRNMTRYKDRLQQDHRTKRFLDEVQDCSRKLIKIYDDEEGVRRAEIDRLGGATQFSGFYERLKDIKEYYRRNAMYETTQPPDDDAILDSQMPLEFTGEEMYGRYLDLHEFYQKYINLTRKQAPTSAAAPRAAADADNGAADGEAGDGDAAARQSGANEGEARGIEYITYVQQFAHFHRVPRRVKFSKAYLEYVQSLLRYVISFHERTRPLEPVLKLLSGVEDSFAQKWDAGEILGWEDRGEGAATQGDMVLDPDAFDSPQELLELGADKVKAALEARGLKSGGTPEQRAQRLFLCAGKPLTEVPASAFAPGAAPAAALAPAARERRLAQACQVANLECKVVAVVDSLDTVVDDTHGWVEKKLAQNYEELKADMEREDFDVGGDASDDEDEYVYNPLKLPIGVDGKPIPYWLYKLHGLNQEYVCDICGGDIFKGRREYERHFKEAKHINAMRALGIPSSKAFFEVTKVDEALALWENLKHRDSGNWHADTQEEFEDDEGNVYNKKTWLDLKRQGLV